jgi:polyphosphate kinase
VDIDSPGAFISRELSWLAFASRVVAQAENRDVPLLERVKFLGICGMLHDEFFMKRISGLKRQAVKQSTKLSIDGRTPTEELQACRKEILDQMERLSKVIRDEVHPAMVREGCAVVDCTKLKRGQRDLLREYFRDSVLPVLTPLAVDSEHPFPFISNRGLNLCVLLPGPKAEARRFVRIKVPDNRPRWVPVPGGGGFVALEQLIAENLDLLYPDTPGRETHLFRVTRGAEGREGRPPDLPEDDDLENPGSIVRQVTSELKARRFAGVVRLELDAAMPKRFRKWLSERLAVGPDDVYPIEDFLALSDLLELKVNDRDDLRFPPHVSVVHPRLKGIGSSPAAIFEAIRAGDILLHHPYHDFDTSVLRFIESAAVDPKVLAIKLTIYRTSSDSPIVRALAEAARRGKQVAVLVEITARFDEAPNIAWGQYLENEGVHVAYGVEKLKTHVKLALVVREDDGRTRRYAHVGTGNYHTGTARAYEDLGILTGDPAICSAVAAVFNSLTGTTPQVANGKLLVAPGTMRDTFTELIRREAEHASAGRPSGIVAKMNQLQDPSIIKELYRASQAGVPICLNVRGLSCLRPGLAGLSETVRLFSVVGRFLEHSRIYRFENGGAPEYYLGSADWMKRNLDNRIETIAPVLDPRLMQEIDAIFEVYEHDNASAWDCGSDGVYRLRAPRDGDERRAAQELFIRMAAGEPSAVAAAQGRLGRAPLDAVGEEPVRVRDAAGGM